MPAPVSYTVGPGQDYADPGAFVADIDVGIGNPADNDEVWTVDVYRQTGNAAYSGASGEQLNLDFATACTATQFATVQCASGEGFRDNRAPSSSFPGVDGDDGVLIESAEAVSCLSFGINAEYCVIDGIQCYVTSGSFPSGYGYGFSGHADAGGARFQNILAEKAGGARSQVCSVAHNPATGRGCAEDCIVIDHSTDASKYAYSSTQGSRNETYKNCIAVKPSDVTPGAGSAGFYFGSSVSSGAELISCAAFGFDEGCIDDSGGIGGDYNATDAASGMPGGNSQHSLTYADQFDGTTAAGQDWRTKSGADLIDAGDPSNSTATDILGTSRDSNPDVGAFEFAAGGSSTPLLFDRGMNGGFRDNTGGLSAREREIVQDILAGRRADPAFAQRLLQRR